MKAGGHVYMMGNQKGGTIYIGVTADLAARIYQHRIGKGSAFCRKYGLTRLVWYEEYLTIEEAIAAEKRMKEWKRAWKVEAIERVNSDWRDLYPELAM